MNKKPLLFLGLVALFMLSACASQPDTRIDPTAGGVYSDSDSGYTTTAVMEIFKKTNNSLSHNAAMAVDVGGVISNALRSVKVNVAYPSFVDSEFKARGNIDMVKEGVAVARKENKNFVLFLDIQTHKRRKTVDGDRIANAIIDAWLVDAENEKLVFKLSQKGSKLVDEDARLTEINDSLRELLLSASEELGKEASRLFEAYLSAS
jgi:hypothetical protein